jgi:hypothetical protein
VRFDIIDPPTADFRPVSPKRTPMLAAVLMAALGGGAGVAYLITLLKPVIHSAKQLAELTGVTVLGVVSASRLIGNSVSMRRHYWRYSLACGTLFVGLVLVVLVGRSFAPLTLHFGHS